MKKCDQGDLKSAFNYNENLGEESSDFITERFLTESLCIEGMDEVIFSGGRIAPIVKFLAVHMVRCDSDLVYHNP